MPAPQVTFTPSASATFNAGQIAAVVALPAVDANNSAVVVQNLGPGLAVLVAGSPPGPLFNTPGVISLQAGQQVLTSAPGLTGGTVASVQAQGGARVTVMRGTTAEFYVFAAPTAAVI